MRTPYINGDAAEYTGNESIIHGQLFYEVRIIEGRRTGELAVTATSPEGVNPNAGRFKKEWADQQAQFSRLHKISKASK